ncbi:LptA/OstA family protein [Granulicella arctica]|uniref:LptA/OstA family protein n=1 Tax=Granulicella arctica TaxID=940613 RepID=UPI0021DF4E99|nr:LptA/OstA family protein [Granulicella arctica]
MSTSIDRLRVWLLVGAALLVLVIAGFLGYARYRTHRFLAGLPAKLGIDIRRETNGYTYSQSVKGKTVMTLHAAKAVEHSNGKLTLHDVGMILYGRKQDRADRISGSEFEYDQASGVVRAMGEVHIDLQAPASANGKAKVGPPANSVPNVADEMGDENKRVIHVKTSGLVYIQKLGVAATDQDVEFKFGGMTGHATGAEYNSDTGVLILQADVKTVGLQHGRSVVLNASHAEMQRENQVALLTQAKYVSPGQTARGDHAIVHLRSDGSPERIEAEGNIVLEGPASGTITAPRADVLLNAAGEAQKAHLFGTGGVHYADVSSLRVGKGQAEDAQVAFDAAGRPENVVLVGAVHITERSRAADSAGSAWSVRDATAGRMTFALAGDSSGKRKELREATATSAAHMTLVSEADTPGAATSEISGDTLHGHFTGAGKAVLLSSLQAVGHTSLHRLNGKGAEQTSSGDTVDVDLRPASKARRSGGGQTGSEEIVKAVQSGHVVLTSRAAAKAGAGPPVPTHATADLALYEGDADHLTLTGHAQVTDAGSTVSANKIVMEHESGDATAEGAVKANYLQANAAEPVHVLAERAELKHDSGQAFFYGAAGKLRPARLWQGASQVEAPVLELDQQKRTMTAHGEAADVAPVHAVLVGKSAAKAGSETHPSVVRIAARTMVYQDVARQVDFGGDVKVEDADGTLRALQATAYLQPAPAAGTVASKKDTSNSAGTSGAFFGGSVDRIVANGKVEMDQTGRRASGEQLVYTANDGMFVLTGTPTVLPKLIDEVQGTVTGTRLSFHTGDDSVMVTGDTNGNEQKAGQRVHTVTRVKQK